MKPKILKSDSDYQAALARIESQIVRRFMELSRGSHD